jgi:hypothetical protein
MPHRFSAKKMRFGQKATSGKERDAEQQGSFGRTKSDKRAKANNRCEKNDRYNRR